jgi:hypothetical protein
MIGREIENARNNRGESQRNSECNALGPGKSTESVLTTPQSNDQPNDKADNETERGQRKKDQHSAFTFEIRNVIKLGHVERRHDRENPTCDSRQKRDRDDARLSL